MENRPGTLEQYITNVMYPSILPKSGSQSYIYQSAKTFVMAIIQQSVTDHGHTNEKGVATYSDAVSNNNAADNMFLNAASASGLWRRTISTGRF